MTDAVVTADPEGIQGARVALPDAGMFGQGAKLPQSGGADPQQAADFAGPVNRTMHNPLDPQEFAQVGFGQAAVESVEGVDGPKTAGGALGAVHRLDPTP